MSTLALEDVRHVAELARLSLSPDEEARTQGQLSAVLDAVEALRQLPTDGVEPTSHAVSAATPLREDTVQPSLDAGRALANAPARGDTHFAVPKVLE